jgi:hypothetical protein
MSSSPFMTPGPKIYESALDLDARLPLIKKEMCNK